MAGDTVPAVHRRKARRELAGRRMREGYSALVMGTTRAVGPPRSAESEKMAAASSAQVAVAAPAMWNSP